MNEVQSAHLHAAQHEIIALFVELVQSFGAPKSLGAIYGLLFASESPLAFDQIVAKLTMSAGSTSQGLKLLKNIGAIRPIFVPGERRDFYVAETQLRTLVGGFLRHRLDPQLASINARLDAFLQEQSTTEHVHPTHLKERLTLLEEWQTQAKRIPSALLATLDSAKAANELSR